ncbi:MarR family transcriptional regulator [Paenibacillus sp. P26]|nr:MarR family transcriptional regulator [Paenibacillus sp. P26]UUZ92671.1 MarR family transcriptional regulator [Paenibacillus sp. P25]
MRKKIEKDHSSDQQLPRLGTAPYLRLMEDSASKDTKRTAAHSGLLLLWISDNILDLVELHLSPYGISESKLDLLMLLYLHQDKPDITPSAIASRLGIRRASATALLDWLEKRSWIERRTSEQNRRMVHVRLTTEGRKLIEEALPAFWRSCASFIDDLDQEEQDLLQKLLVKLNASLEKKLGVGR